MELLKKYKGVLFIVMATVVCFIVANQIRVANGGEFVSGVMYFRYAGYFLIALLIFKIGVKAKLFIVHNIAMIVLIFIGLEIIFYSILGSPTKENKGFEMPNLDSDDIQQQIGYLPIPDTVLNEVLIVEGDTSFNVDYTIDKFRKRITPKMDSTDNNDYALFFGCSIAYGYGLKDDETIPYNYQANGDITSYNFAYNGHGTNHVAARLEQDNLDEQVVEKNGKAFYLFFWDHIARAVGTMRRHTSWLHFAPYYYMDNDSLIRNKMFKDGRPVTSYFYESVYQSSILEYFEVDFPLSLNKSHFDLVAEMIEYSKNHYSKQFGNDEFYTVIMPSYKGYTDADLELFIKIVESKGIDVIDLSDIVEYGSKYTLKGDAHPNADFSKFFSKKLYNSTREQTNN
jgi:hypothetical protein